MAYTALLDPSQTQVPICSPLGFGLLQGERCRERLRNTIPEKGLSFPTSKKFGLGNLIMMDGL